MQSCPALKYPAIAIASAAAAKSALQTAGMYYQYPVGFAGQSPNTGTGSDV